MHAHQFVVSLLYINISSSLVQSNHRTAITIWYVHVRYAVLCHLKNLIKREKKSDRQQRYDDVHKVPFCLCQQLTGHVELRIKCWRSWENQLYACYVCDHEHPSTVAMPWNLIKQPRGMDTMTTIDNPTTKTSTKKRRSICGTINYAVARIDCKTRGNEVITWHFDQFTSSHSIFFYNGENFPSRKKLRANANVLDLTARRRQR